MPSGGVKFKERRKATMKFRNAVIRYFVPASVVCSASAAHAVYTPPTDLPSLFAIVDVSTFSTQVLVMYGLGAGLLLIGLGWYILKSGGKKSVKGTL